MELVIIARFHAQHEQELAVAKALREQVGLTRTEPGCIEIGAYACARDPRLFFIRSRWADETSFEVHAGLPQTVRFVETMDKLIDHPFDVSRVRKIA